MDPVRTLGLPGARDLLPHGHAEFYQALLAAAPGVASGVGQAVAGGPSSAKTGDIAVGAGGISIAPIGVNLGEILKGLEENPLNGGAGLTRAPRLFGDDRGPSFNVSASGGRGAPPLLLVALVGLALIVYARRKRG